VGHVTLPETKISPRKQAIPKGKLDEHFFRGYIRWFQGGELFPWKKSWTPVDMENIPGFMGFHI